MSEPSCPRRRFLEMLAQGGALAGAASLGVGCGAPAGKLSVGNASAFPLGTLNVVAGDSLAVGHDAGGLYALTTICTHAGCDMATDGTVSASGLFCNCHGSRFDANGAVLQGPASDALEHYALTVDGAGAVTVDTATSVAATARTPA